MREIKVSQIVCLGIIERSKTLEFYGLFNPLFAACRPAAPLSIVLDRALLDGSAGPSRFTLAPFGFEPIAAFLQKKIPAVCGIFAF